MNNPDLLKENAELRIANELLKKMLCQVLEQTCSTHDGAVIHSYDRAYESAFSYLVQIGMLERIEPWVERYKWTAHR